MGVVDVLEGEGDQATEDLANTQTGVPDGESRCLLLLVVVLGADKHKARSNGSLKDTQEDTGGHERVVVKGTGSSSTAQAPKGDIETQPLSSWELLQEISWAAIHVSK